MMNKDIKNVINDRLSCLNVNDELKERIIYEKNVKVKKFKKSLWIAVAACLCLFITFPIMAKNFSGFNYLLSKIDPNYGENLQQIEMSSESNGIKMEVIGAMNDNSSVSVYITMQDLTGDRIDENLDLYHFNILGTEGLTHEVIDYNEETKTATIRLYGAGGKNLNGKNIGVIVRSFLSKKWESGEFEPEININDVSHNPDKISLDMNNIPGGGGDFFDELKGKDKIQVLKPNELNITLPNIDFSYISNMGIIDGRLHVQVRFPKKEVEKSHIDDHGFLTLYDLGGNRVPYAGVSFGIDENGKSKYGNEYEEYIYNVDVTKLSNYKLVGEHFATNGEYVEGEWKNTFKVESIKEIKEIDYNMNIGKIKIDNVSLSSMGITLNGNGKEESLENTPNIDVNIPELENSEIEFTIFMQYHNNETSIKLIPSKPIDVEMINRVIINGNEIKFK